MTMEFESHDSGHQLRAESWLPYDRRTVFEFFSDPGNLERLTPPWSQFEILTNLNVEMREGALIDYRMRLRGIPMKWRSEISVWEPPFRFVDRMLRGPYREWVHEHRFEECDGGTLVTDEVHYAVRGGNTLHRLLVRPDLERIFRYRRERVEEELRADLDQAVTPRERARRQFPLRPASAPLPAPSRPRPEGGRGHGAW